MAKRSRSHSPLFGELDGEETAETQAESTGGLGGEKSKGKERPLAGEAKRCGKASAPEKTPGPRRKISSATPCPGKKQSLRELRQLMPGPAMVGKSSLIQQAANYVEHLKDPSSKLQRPDGMRPQDESSTAEADAYAALQAAVPGSAYLKPGWLLPYTIQYITEHLTAAEEKEPPAASNAAPPRDKEEEEELPPAVPGAGPAMV